MDEVTAPLEFERKTWKTYLTWADSYSRTTTLRLCESKPFTFTGMVFNGEERNLLEIDLRGDQAYWRGLKPFLLWLGRGKSGGTVWAKQVYKVARTRRNEAQRKDYEQALPSNVVMWANGRLAAAIKRDHLDCADSERVARIGNKSQMRRFIRSRSCCGSAEWEEVCPVDGKRYLLGLNFGH